MKFSPLLLKCDCFHFRHIIYRNLLIGIVFRFPFSISFAELCGGPFPDTTHSDNFSARAALFKLLKHVVCNLWEHQAALRKCSCFVFQLNGLGSDGMQSLYKVTDTVFKVSAGAAYIMVAH
ncbi:hypothetical protein P3S68_027284 [Capsicum galapagoense]